MILPIREELKLGLGIGLAGSAKVAENRGLFQFGGNNELLDVGIKGDAQHIRLAADLAVLYILLLESTGVVNDGVIPFAAACALEAGFHVSKLLVSSF